MDGQSRNTGTFPLTWTLLDPQAPVQNYSRHPAPPNAFPREWSLSTVPESISDKTETESERTSPSTIRGDFPIILADSNKPASKAIAPSTFETNWAIPANRDSESDVHNRLPYPNVDNARWPPGITHHGAHGMSYADTMMGIPGHPPNRVLNEQHTTTSSSGVPGNFKHQGYSNLQVSPEIALGSANSEPVDVTANDIIHQLVGHYSYTSPPSAVSGATSANPVLNMNEVVAGQVSFRPQLSATSHFSPWENDSSSYQLPRPAGFTSNQVTPHSTVEAGSASAGIYRPPRPAGFDSTSISPATSSSTSAHRQQPGTSPWYDARFHPEPLPAIYEHRGSSGGFAPITIPDHAGTLPDNVSSWLLSDADRLYNPPAPPMTATAPWSRGFQ